MATATVASWEYRNDFFSIIIREHGQRPGSYLFYSGVSLPKFDPLCWGKTGICSNAAFKGLQQLRADVSSFALQRGISTQYADTPDDLQRGYGTGWYQENALLLEDASPGSVQEVLAFSARNLVQTVLTACLPGVTVPEGLGPAAMQAYLESYGVPNYREAAPPPIAKPQPIY